MQRCPCCRARLGGAARCPRCGADLGKIIGAGQAARFWLAKAIQAWRENEAGQSVSALEYSLHLKKTELALVFRDFLIDRHCQGILGLLEQRQPLSAKQRLYSVRHLLPHSPMLRQLNAFTDYLLARKHGTG
ncbi:MULTISPECIES: hypothetical protein [Methylobacter]|uniref:hypothetical protein n=1 Tax=Methylobacter TaxID=429 RepID=UPI0003692914|nr:MULTISPECIES: hypothetical protein [Methylobacter]